MTRDGRQNCALGVRPDTSLAAGGTIGLVLDEIVRRGASVNMIRIVGIVAAPPALKMLSEKYPGASPRTLLSACRDRYGSTLMAEVLELANVC